MNCKISGLFLLIGAVLPHVAAAADVAKGQTLAKRWCATCHVVASDQSSATGEAPPFAVIAKTPGLNADKLTKFLLSPHPKMPDMNLSRSEAGDLAAYIVTQQK